MKLSLLLCVVIALKGLNTFNTENQEWGFTEVRPGAHLFWWLFRTGAEVKNVEERPLVVWLQGGPGASSSGIGNLEEIGPWDFNLKRRNQSWIDHINVLFVDSPVGTGYSYVKNSSLLTKNINEIAADLLVLLEDFYIKHVQFRSTPLYIFGQSYGGKCAVVLAKLLTTQKSTNINLKGVALGDSWISPIDSVKNWAPYLYHIGQLDEKGFVLVNEMVEKMDSLLKQNKNKDATEAWSETEHLILNLTNDIDMHNGINYGDDKTFEIIESIMNGYVKIRLNIPDFVNFSYFNDLVFEAQAEDFMIPVTNVVESLLNTTDITISVYSGQFDVIVETAGSLAWVSKLKWPKYFMWYDAIKLPIVINGNTEGFMKKVGPLGFYWVNKAGHSVPADNPIAMKFILQDIMKISF